MPYLIVREPERVAFSAALENVFRVGRSADNALVLTDRHVSRNHIEFSVTEQQWCVSDLGSRHGTLVNGEPVKKQVLRDGDRIQIGRAMLTYCEHVEPSPILHQQPSTIETLGLPAENNASRRLRLLFELSRALRVMAETDVFLRNALQAIAEVLGCDRGLIGIKEEHTASMRRISWVRNEQLPERDVVISGALLEAILKHREAVIAGNPTGSGPHSSAVGAPLQLGDRVLGFIYVENSARQDRFSPEDLDFLSALASLTAAALDCAERFQRATIAAEALREATEELIGESPPMQALKAQIQKYAQASSANVLIHGESGTGKELVARTLHSLSPRSDEPFIAVNCAALPETMIESELFGFDKGAFTGAIKNKRGKFFLAHRGTLFLDEIGDLTLAAQAKVLRAIEDGEIQPLGSERALHVDVRVISATHKNLFREVEEHRFREDLYYRLNTLELQLEPLRRRGDDVLLLARSLLQRAADRMAKPLSGFTESALAVIQRYAWPGNIRELKNEIERAVISADSKIVDRCHLSPGLGMTARPSASQATASLAEQFVDLDLQERALVQDALSRARGNVSEAARLLGISRIRLKRRLDRYQFTSSEASGARALTSNDDNTG